MINIKNKDKMISCMCYKGEEIDVRVYILFDMDSTITKEEVLPTIAQKINRNAEMRNLTEATMRGEIPFRTSFFKKSKDIK